jgi:hypothetical protein
MKAITIPLAIIVSFVAALLFSGCTNETQPTSSSPTIKIVDSSVCLNHVAEIVPNKDKDCFEYEYLNGILKIKHLNAPFNCCPGEFLADISVENGVITITENSAEDACSCYCIFNLDYEIQGIVPGNYTIRFIEHLQFDGDEPLEAQVSLTPGAKGDYCVLRGHYPWSED